MNEAEARALLLRALDHWRKPYAELVMAIDQTVERNGIRVEIGWAAKPGGAIRVTAGLPPFRDSFVVKPG